ncbi:carbohydrate ABC transporter permease [Oceanispirochaeta sp.]|jgi:multiple sugar transport system permease protein|uniref:carbohydrate ABC transporter permease n=1 Tax=Oceanispirochaeta sp. TaxID=2035350 RepID=UPI00261891E5|nr:carbohydrate ABC transporter permease [Oceanispirochaeta sp.]MDA3955081.1 carbohydrate ABC transporter permease [Oceanispirochaeta sp.]
MTLERSNYVGKVVRNFLLASWAVFALFPILWMILITFKSDIEVFNTTFLFHPTLENYDAVLLKTDYFKAFLDNIIVSGGAVLVSVIAGVPAAYALARFEFKKKEDLAFTILSFKFAPEILVILPLFMIYQKLGIYDTYFGLIWVYQLITMPLLVWVVRGYFEDVSVEIEQAAKLDGYRWWEIFYKFLLPLIKPGLVSSALLAFIFAWNSFTFPLLLTSFNVETVTVASLKYIASDTVHYGQMAVAATVAALPEVILALLIQKHLVRGLSFGAVKG